MPSFVRQEMKTNQLDLANDIRNDSYFKTSFLKKKKKCYFNFLNIFFYCGCD